MRAVLRGNRSKSRPIIAENWARISSGTYDENAMKRNFAACAMSVVFLGCSTHHWAEVESSRLPPPSSQPVLHTSRIIIDVSPGTEENQCVVNEKHHPVCFYNVRPSLQAGLARNLWPSFPEVVVGAGNTAGPKDYVLQVDVTLDALPPDDEGPGWSAGVRGRYRLLRAGVVLKEETTASRSRAHFPYGGPLGQGATEAMDATILHIAESLFQVEEAQPDEPATLPQVAARAFTPHAESNSNTLVSSLATTNSKAAATSLAPRPRLTQEPSKSADRSAVDSAPLAKTNN